MHCVGLGLSFLLPKGFDDKMEEKKAKAAAHESEGSIFMTEHTGALHR